MNKEEFLSVLGGADESVKNKMSEFWDSVDKSRMEYTERIKQLEAQLSGESRKKSELETHTGELMEKIKELQQVREIAGTEKMNLEQKIQILMDNQQKMSERLETAEREKQIAQIQNVRTQQVAELTAELNLNSGMTKHLINTLQTDAEFENSLSEFKKAAQETKAQIMSSAQPKTPPVGTFGSSKGEIIGIQIV